MTSTSAEEEVASLEDSGDVRFIIRSIFRKAYRDMVMFGYISAESMEDLEEIGIHPQSAMRVIKNYMNGCEEMLNNEMMPSIEHLYIFLDDMADNFFDAYRTVIIDNDPTRNYLVKDKISFEEEDEQLDSE